MNKLYFVKFYHHTNTGQIVWMGTAKDEEQAQALAWDFIHPLYRKQHKLAECTFVCNTPDEVINFEPV